MAQLTSQNKRLDNKIDIRMFYGSKMLSDTSCKYSNASFVYTI